MFVATIILVAILTALIFILTIVAFSSICKSEKREIELGNRDAEIKKDIEKEKKKSSKAFNIIGSIFGGLIALSLLAASVTAITYKAQGEQFAINNQVSLVIVSDSMNGFYNDVWKTKVLTEKEDAEKDQFKIGDLLTFEKVTEEEELTQFDVYGYKNSKGQIITHRYIETIDDKLVFRGDNTGGRDSYVDRSQVVLHYTDHKIPQVGMFVLFSQSGFGLYAFISVIGIYVLAEVYGYKYDKLIKNRLAQINQKQAQEEPKEDLHDILTDGLETEPKRDENEIVPVDKRRKVEFTTRDGRHIVFYKKEKADEK